MRSSANPSQLWVFGPRLTGSMPTENAVYSGLVREKLNPLLHRDLPSCEHCDTSANLFPVQRFYSPPTLSLHGISVPHFENVYVRSTNGKLYMRTNDFFLSAHSSVLALSLSMEWSKRSADGMMECKVAPPVSCSMTQERHQSTVGYILAWWHGSIDRRAPCWETWPHADLTDGQFLLDIFTQAHFWSAVDLLRKLFNGESTFQDIFSSTIDFKFLQ